MSIFKSICADLGENPFPTRVSFGGGFQMPKSSENNKNIPNKKIEEQGRNTASFKQLDSDAGKKDVLSSLDKAISQLRGDSNSIAEIRVKYTSDFPSQQLTSLEELEKLRIIHQEKLKVLESEYKQKKEQKAEKKDVLQDFSEYKKAKIGSKFKFNHQLEYSTEKDEPDEKETLLKWLFSKLDINASGLIEKHEMLQEICDNDELREYFGISSDADTLEELNSLIPADFLSQSDFIKFFLSIKPISKPKESLKSLTPRREESNKPQEYPIVVLTHKQLQSIEKVFKETDIHGDMAVQKFEFLQSLRTDDDIIKILECNAIEISLKNFITLEEALDRIQESGELYEYITYSQFLNFFYIMFPKKNWTPEEMDKKINLDPLYIQILQDIFDSLPRKTKGFVSVKLLIDSLKEDPQVNEFLKEKVKGTEDVEGILKKIDKESAESISWEDFIDYFSDRGKPLLKTQENTLVNRGNYYAIKQDFYKENQSISPQDEKSQKKKFNYDFYSPGDKAKKKSKKNSNSSIKFTVPTPFEFEQREKIKNKSIRQIKFEQYINEKRREEENHINYHTKAAPVPAEVIIPKYNTMLAAQEERRNIVKQNSKKITKEREKPFQFYIREMNKPKSEEIKEEPYKFKAKPPPPSNSIPLYEQMSRKLEDDRKSRIEAAAKKALEEAKLPPRMERNQKGDKNLSVPPPISALFKAKKPPEFAKLWDNLGKSLEKNKKSFQPTQPKEINLTEAKKKSNAEEVDVNSELIQKGFLTKGGSTDGKPFPEPSKKQLEAEENAKKRREDMKKNKEDKIKEKEDREAAEKDRIKQMNEKLLEGKEKLQEKLKDKIPISQTISSEYSKTNSQPRSLTSIKLKMQARGIPMSNIIGEVDGFLDINAEDLV